MDRETNPAVTPAPSAPPFCVIIPAHNEARVIERTLNGFLGSWPGGKLPQVIVVCNGCTDGTATIARRAAPGAQVVELAASSKTAAINEGLDRAEVYPVIVLDADVTIAPRSLCAVADALRDPAVMAASPAPLITTTHADYWTRCYYRVWSSSGYHAQGVGGAGVYGLSQAGVELLGRFPPVIGDDTYVRWFFPYSSQRRVSHSGADPVQSVVIAPRRLGDLLACEARWQAGNIQLRRILPEPKTASPAPGNQTGAVSQSDRLIYFGIKLAGRVRYLANRIRSTDREWHRGGSAR